LLRLKLSRGFLRLQPNLLLCGGNLLLRQLHLLIFVCLLDLQLLRLLHGTRRKLFLSDLILDGALLRLLRETITRFAKLRTNLESADEFVGYVGGRRLQP